MIQILPEFEEETELYECKLNECLIIITDRKVILRYEVDMIFEDHIFTIIDIKWAAYSDKNKNIFAVKTKYPKLYSLSWDKVLEILTIVGLLYSRLKGKEMKVYKLPVEDFKEYEARKGS